MIEIKFRAWIKGKMYHNIGLHPHICCDHSKVDIDDLNYINPLTTNEGVLTLFNTDENIMQFTGLRDKNGVEIYKGDILDFDVNEWNRSTGKPQSEWEYPKWEVEWNDKNGCWDTGGGTTSECGIYKSVIGNIYEHPHLLK